MGQLIKSEKILKSSVTNATIEINKNCDIELHEIRLKFIDVRALGNASSIKAVVKSKINSTLAELDIVFQNLVSISESWNYVAELCG